MYQAYMASIFSYAGGFAPAPYFSFCQGQTLAIANNDALFTLIGTTFGGDGQTTFNLPDLRGRIPVGQGQGPGLSSYVVGQISGTEQVTLLSTQMPQHTHPFGVSSTTGDNAVPNSTMTFGGAYASGAAVNFYGTGTPGATLSPTSVSISGGNDPISILQPILAGNYIICVQGLFPSRN